MTAMTAGDLTHAHIGATVALTLSVSMTQPWDSEPQTSTRAITGDVVRVQHSAGETLLVLTSWSGSLDPTHPTTIETTETGA